MDDIRLRMEGFEPQVVEDPEERDRIYCFKCDEQFVVEHVGDNEAWVCPACAHPNLNLHKHFLALGVLFALLAVAGLVLTVIYAVVYSESDIAFVYLMWSCVQTTASGYAVMAIFGDRRAYGLRPLRYLLPALYASAVAAAIIYWFPYHLLTVILVGVAFAGIGAYVGYVFWHTFRMAVPHKPREAVVRPMYTLISVTVHVLLLLYMALVTVVVHQRTPGTSSVEFGRPGGYVPQAVQQQELEQPEEEIQPDEQEIEPNLEEIEVPENRQDIDYQTENSLIFNRTEVPEKPRKRPVRRTTKNVRFEQRYDREYALEQGGGSDKTEWAVLLALRWLKAHQNEDGSWGDPPIQAAMTGLALLCFLGHGEDHLSVEFGPTVRAAISWFVGKQDEDGYFTKEMRWSYQHGMATYAMAEAYGMTGLEDLRPVVAKAVRRICEGQTPEGGWYYEYTKVQNDGSPWAGGDTSVSGWQIQALTAAWYAGIRFSNNMLRDARRRAIQDIKSRFNAEGGCGYQGTGPSRSKEDNYCTTGVGTLCLQFLGQDSCNEVKWGLDLMRRYSCDWERTTGGAFGPFYGWYYVTQAMYHATANPKNNVYWKYWNPLFSTMLTGRQQKDGHWDYPDNAGGQRESSNFTGNNRDLYATCMCCLMLEVYYRYLPTYRPTH
jgi:hypothetical protein